MVNDIHGTGQWSRLNRGDVVSDDRVIRTLGGGNVEFQSGAETVAMGPGTQAQIVDRKGQLYTTVVEQVGTVSISAEARQVQHFAVETPFLVAVVKGTMFTVVTNTTASRVVVSRGLVAVTDFHDHHTVMLPAGRAGRYRDGARATQPITGTPIAALVHPTVNGVVEDEDDASTGVIGSTTTAVGNVAGGVVGDVGSVARRRGRQCRRRA